MKRRNDGEAIGYAVGYAVGHIESWLNELAAQSGGALSAAELAARVGTLLLASERGAGAVRPSDQVPAVRRARAERSETLEPLAVARRPRRKAPKAKGRVGGGGWGKFRTPEARRREESATRRKISVSLARGRKSLKAYWAKMTAKERSDEMQRRMRVRLEKAA
jgi:hypothetical protein